jgi:chromosome partitioning protein
MDVIGVCNLKGGAGKTTTAVHIGACYHAQGKRVAVLDADKQATALNWQETANFPFKVYEAGKSAKEIKDKVAELGRSHDVIVIDSENSSLVVTNVAFAATRIIIPVQPTDHDVNRLVPTYDILQNVFEVRQLNPHDTIRILVTRYKPNTKKLSEFLSVMGELNYNPFKTMIRDMERYKRLELPDYLDEYMAVVEEMEG